MEANPDNMFCEQSGATLKEFGYIKVRDELEYVPAKVKITLNFSYLFSNIGHSIFFPST